MIAASASSPFTRTPDNRHAQLLTPVSHFPSRMLPPIGTTPRNFSAGASTHISIPIGSTVEVRRFNMRTRTWMTWIPGRIVGHRVERFHVGTELDLYDVQTRYSGQQSTSVDTYIPFLGEMRDGQTLNPSDSVNELLSKVADMKKVFACVQVPSPSGTVPTWMPAVVVSKRTDPVNRVFVLAGPLSGQTDIAAPHILPYNPETAEAIKKTGQKIYWENGTV